MKPDEPLSLPEARQVLLVSYRLSQGRAAQQQALFAAVANLRPQWHWSFSEQETAALQEHLVPALVAFGKSGLHIPLRQRDVERDLTYQIQNLKEHLLPPLSLECRRSPMPDLSTITTNMILYDHHYLCTKGGRGRPRKQGASVSTPVPFVCDQYASTLRLKYLHDQEKAQCTSI